ncbi:MAG: glutamate racemase [Deltaproteobacteria bacterium]|nr:glutamate racemase [Deltaproteobacteria bacterium]
MSAIRPIGIFDSGIGGLTVLKEIIRTLPNEDTIYLGDTARVPYGTKSKETVIKYSLKITDFLLRFDIKMLVVACNTATAYALEELRSTLPIPVVGVIEPGAAAAVRASVKGKIGVIGTEGTIRSSAYVNAIKKVDPTIEVVTQPCQLFVPLVEEGWTDNEVARLTAETYLQKLKNASVDVLLAGCTHYPLLKPILGEIMGEDVEIIDSAATTADAVRLTLESKGLLTKARTAKAKHAYYVTDSPERFMKVGKVFIGEDITEATLVDIGG